MFEADDAGYGSGLRRERLFSHFVRTSAPIAHGRTEYRSGSIRKKSGQWQKYRKEDVQAVMTKVAQDVWHTQYSGASAQHMEQLFLDGQRAYFRGDYDGAMHNFLAAERIVSKYPNDITAGAPR